MEFVTKQTHLREMNMAIAFDLTEVNTNTTGRAKSTSAPPRLQVEEILEDTRNPKFIQYAYESKDLQGKIDEQLKSSFRNEPKVPKVPKVLTIS
jgi:hypothetical protein